MLNPSVASAGASAKASSSVSVRAVVSGPSEFQRPSGGAAGRLAVFESPSRSALPQHQGVQAQAYGPSSSRPGGRSGRGDSDSAASVGRVGQASASNNMASFYSDASPSSSRPGGALRMQLAGGGGGDGGDGIRRGSGGGGGGEGGAESASVVPWVLLFVAAGGLAYLGNNLLNKPTVVKACCSASPVAAGSKAAGK